MQPTAHIHTRKGARCFVLLNIILFLAVPFWGGCSKQRASAPPPASAEDRLYARAEAFFKAGTYDNALADYQAYVSQYPRHAHSDAALMKMASIYVISSREQDARVMYSRILSEYPGSLFAADARVEILASLYRQGEYSALFAEAASIDAGTLSPSSRTRLFKMLGDAHLSSGDKKEAVNAYALGGFFASGDAKEIRSVLERLDSEEIQDLLNSADHLPKGYLLYQLGLNYMKAGQDRAAEETFDEFLKTFPGHTLSAEVTQLSAQLRKKSNYDRFTIGCLLPLTGAHSNYGKKAQSGIELALSRFRSRNPDSPIKIIIRDTGETEPEALAAVRELIEAGVAAMIGPITMAGPVAEEAQHAGVPIITLSGKDDILDIGDYVFRNFITPQSQVTSIATYFVKTLGLKRFAILYPDEKYGKTFMNLFWDQVIECGGTVVGCESYKVDGTDFEAPIKKLVGVYYHLPEPLKAEIRALSQPRPEALLKALSRSVLFEAEFSDLPDISEQLDAPADQPSPVADMPSMPVEVPDPFDSEGNLSAADKNTPAAVVDFDAIFIPDSPKKAGLILPQLAFYDVTKATFIGTNLWHSDELIQMARVNAQNSVIADGFFVESSLPLVREFVDLFQSIYGTAPGFIEAVSYDTACILLDIVTQSDITFRSAIREKLITMPPFQGVTGATEFSESGEAEKQLYLLQIKGGRFQEISTPRPDRTDP